jgi:hypothetical protein
MGLIALSLFSAAKSQGPPSPPVVIEGYVTIQTTSGTNITAPAGLTVYTKQQNTTIPNVAGSTPTNTQGYYQISVGNSTSNVPPEGAPLDVWVQGINVTRIIFSYHNNPYTIPPGTGSPGLNLTVIDTTPPVIQVISPAPSSVVPVNQPVWVNASVTDDLLVNATSITMTLNQTQLAWAYNNATGLLSAQTGALTQGFYVANVTASDIAGNTATEAWNFTVSAGIPPTISITSPTTASLAYTQSGKPIQVIFSYTEASPLNWTIAISNSTYTVVSVTNTTVITPGTSTTATVSVTIPQTAPEGTYDLAVTMYNTYNLSATATQTSAVMIDNTPPTIGTPYQDPPGQYVNSSVTLNVNQSLDVSVSVNITDTASGVEQAILSYNINATGWVNQTMTATGNLYNATIPGQTAGTTVTYYITAIDRALNTARTPTGQLNYPYNVIIPEFNSTALLLILALILAIGTTLAIVTSKTTKRKSLQPK